MKHFLITGGTGLIGSALCKVLLAAGHKVTVLSRNAATARRVLDNTVTIIEELNQITDKINIDVVINLAGAPIADKHWTKKRKKIIEQSRVDLSQNLVSWMKNHPIPPAVLISGSAVGWYGDNQDTLLDEQSAYHDEYTHQLCEKWEQTARKAEEFGTRVCIVRTGLVLAPKGGFLKKMLPPFKLGVGGRLGSGQQYMPWIHINDMVNILIFLASNKELNGVFNATAPHPVSNDTFSKALANTVNRPALFPLPAYVLRLLLGEMSRLLLTGQNAIPAKLQASDFKFEYTDINAALADVLNPTK